MTEARGFTLIEVVVAFALLAAGVAAALGVLGLTTRNAALVEDTSRAIGLADALLARADAEGAGPGVVAGETQGLRWQRVVEPMMSLDEAAQAGSDWLPCRISVDVRWGGAGVERGVRLATIHLRRRE